MNIFDTDELEAWAAELVASWPLPTAAQAALLRATYMAVELDTPAAEPDAA